MELVYTNVPEDMVVFANHGFTRTTQFWRYHAFWLIVGFLLVCLILALASLYWPPVCLFLLSVPALVGWPFYYWWRAPARYRDQVRQTFAKGDPKDLFETRTLTATRDELLARVGENEARFPWSSIPQIVTIPDYTFVHITKATAYVIPRQRVERGDYDDFVRAIGEWYAPARKPVSES